MKFLAVLIVALVCGCAHRSDSKFQQGRGEVGQFILQEAMRRGGTPERTNNLPAVSRKWQYFEDEHGVVIQMPLERFDQVEQLLRTAFGQPNFEPSETTDGGRLGVYRLSDKGGAIQFLRDDNMTQVIVLGPVSTDDLLRRLPAAIASLSSEPEETEAEQDRPYTNDERQRFFGLRGEAKKSFNAGKIEEARTRTRELLELLPKFEGDHWNYGNAVHDANMVLGRIALVEGEVEKAKEYLIAAGTNAGSIEHRMHGPNMSLAKDLLEEGEREVVLEYFQLCRKFWPDKEGKLATWTEAINQGQIPDFGPNLLY